VTWLERAVAKNNYPGRYHLGRVLLTGEGGVPRDRARALSLLESVAASEDAVSMTWAEYYLGRAYDDLNDGSPEPDKAVAHFQRAAAGGQVGAMVSLARLHLQGRGVAKDEARALELLHVAADRHGDPEAMGELGMFYFNQGTEAGFVRARQYLTLAAAKNDINAMLTLGGIYFMGRGAAQSYEEAGRWYGKAAQTGEPIALLAMAALYEKGLGLPRDSARSLALLKRAAEAGHPSGMVAYGQRLQTDDGTGRADPARAFRWFQKAADAGDWQGMEGLADCYARGAGVTANQALAGEWAEKAKQAKAAFERQFGPVTLPTFVP
jgi:uncharacterized protein